MSPFQEILKALTAPRPPRWHADAGRHRERNGITVGFDGVLRPSDFGKQGRLPAHCANDNAKPASDL